jgi:tetratricopeptide (TPR) repeat protein
MTTLRSERLSIPTSPMVENPFPFFQERPEGQNLRLGDGLPLELRELAGWQTNSKILPYRRQDRYSRELVPTQFQAWVLENEWLSATFLPEMGGRMISLVDKEQGRELLARPKTIQPANLAIRDAWFAGGIEWNIGRFGHSVFTCAPVFAAEISDWNGEAGLRLYEFERTQAVLWQIDFYLPAGSKFLLAYTRVVNPRPEPTAMYWWTNMAVPEAPGVRVLAPAVKLIRHDAAGESLRLTDLPLETSANDADITYPARAEDPQEFFWLTQTADLPWITAIDENGYGLVEASTPQLGARKLFCWGSGARGRRWQKYLSPAGDAYLELQAGLAPTQLHGLVMPALAEWDWLEAFGALRIDSRLTHHANWQITWTGVDASIKRAISADQLAGWLRRCQARKDQAFVSSVNHGAGWGALELERCRLQQHTSFPPAFDFPVETLGAEQQRWLKLLNEGTFSTCPGDRLIPGEWLTQKEWRILLESSLRIADSRNWLAWLQLGVMLYEAGDEFGAEQAWLESLAIQPGVWARRNLGMLCRRRNQWQDACLHYGSAWEMANALSQADRTALAQEYLHLLLETGCYEQAVLLYRDLPGAVQQADRVQILRGQVALALDDLDTVDEVLKKEYAVIRENETTLSDMWYEVTARRMAASTGKSLNEELRSEIRRSHRLPEALAF